MTMRFGPRFHGGWFVTAVALVVFAAGCASVDPTLAVRGGGPGRYEPLPEGGYARLVQSTAGPVLLAFHSPNCPYCGSLLKTLRSGVAQGKPWVVYTVDVREETALRGRLGVGPVPTLVYYRNGQEVDRSMGWRPGILLSGRIDRFFE